MQIILDGKEMTDREETHLYLKELLELPDYYGENLDALWDILSVYEDYTEIKIINEEDLFENLDEYGEKLIDLFLDLSEENKNIVFIEEDEE